MHKDKDIRGMKKAIGSLLGFCVLCIWITQCAVDGWNTRKYYFPLKKLEEGKVYAFKNVGNIGPSKVYWYYRAILGKEEVYLTATYYEDQPNPLQLVTERLVENGMIREELFLFEVDSIGKSQRTKAEIEVGDAFPFYVKERGGIFLQKQTWMDRETGHKMTLIKNRIFGGEDTFTWEGKELDAVQFEVKELLIDEADGALELEFSGNEVYAEGLGLVYYEKEIEEGVVMAYRLEDIMEMDDLVKLLLKF